MWKAGPFVLSPLLRFETKISTPCYAQKPERFVVRRPIHTSVIEALLRSFTSSFLGVCSLPLTHSVERLHNDLACWHCEESYLKSGVPESVTTWLWLLPFPVDTSSVSWERCSLSAQWLRPSHQWNCRNELTNCSREMSTWWASTFVSYAPLDLRQLVFRQHIHPLTTVLNAFLALNARLSKITFEDHLVSQYKFGSSQFTFNYCLFSWNEFSLLRDLLRAAISRLIMIIFHEPPPWTLKLQCL